MEGTAERDRVDFTAGSLVPTGDNQARADVVFVCVAKIAEDGGGDLGGGRGGVLDTGKAGC